MTERMGERPGDLERLLDRRLAVQATRPAPVWLWSADVSRLLWANPVGAALLARGGTDGSAPDEIARLAVQLRPGGVASLFRVRGFGRGFGPPLLCACSRVAFDGESAVLVVGQDAAGLAMPLAERVHRLIAPRPEPVAAFTPAGTLIDANAAGRSLISGSTSLAALDAEPLVTAALADAAATGPTRFGEAEIVRLGESDWTVLLVSFSAPAVEPVAAEAAEAAEVEPPPVDTPEPAAELDSASVAEPSVPPPPPPPRVPGEGPPLLRLDTAWPDRRYPLRFVWQMDAEGRFTLGSDEFTDVIGPGVAVALGRPWREIAAVLGLDPDGAVERAVATRETFSGIVVSFPVEGLERRLPAELSGLPVYDRHRVWLGYRGFGICRDIAALTELARAPRPAVFTMPTPPAATPPVAATASERAPPAAGEPPDIAPEIPAEAAPEVVPAAAPVTTLAAEATVENVVPFPAGDGWGSAPAPAPAAAPGLVTAAAGLSAVEHNAFREIARQLHARLAGEPVEVFSGEIVDEPAGEEAAASGSAPGIAPTALLDRMPVGVLIYRYDELLYANRAFLDATGYADLGALAAAGGLDSLFVAGDGDLAAAPDGHGQSLVILTQRGDRMPVAARLFAIPWAADSALALVLMPAGGDERGKQSGLALRRAEATIRDLQAVLDTAFDGVVALSRDGKVASANRSAEALFGAEPGGLAGLAFGDLFEPESRTAALDYLDRVRDTGGLLVAQGQEVIGQVRQSGLIPLFMTIGPMADGSDRLCAVFRDLTPVKKEQQTLAALKQNVDRAAAGKTEFLARLSHDIRTPLNSVLGFSDLILEERHGPLGNERYRDYVRDVRAAAERITALLDDVLNLTRAETGTLELAFAPVDLNEIVTAAVRTMQPQANRERIIIRSSLAPQLQTIVADARSLEQIILNLLGNAIKLTGPGGQVIVSTGQTGQGQVVLRVRDTGVGMSGKEIETVLQPFREVATAPSTATAGLGLPLTKALAEANRGTFAISSRVNDGTLVEVTFPRAKIPAE